jgi:phosphotransferase system enzyme I (PtsI)
VANLYSSADPSVLRLIRMAIEAADRKQVPVNVCGQMSGNSVYTMLLLGLGLRRFSVTPSSIPEIKKICRTVTTEACRHVASRVMGMENAREIKSYLREELKKLLPDLVA